MGKLPAIYANLLVIGGGSPPTDGPPVAEVGGFWRQPDYGLSYLLAARYLIERGREDGCQNELAIPVAYLQRHAFEIALKDLIDDARGIKADQELLAKLKVDRKARYVKPPAVPFKHDLKTLIKLLGKALTEIEFGDVPPEFTTLAKRVYEVEGSDPTRTRYARVRVAKKSSQNQVSPSEPVFEASFPKPVLIRVGETQDQLERLFETYVHAEPWSGNEGLGTWLAEESAALEQALCRYEADTGTPWEK